jgi:hypothetical protein
MAKFEGFAGQHRTDVDRIYKAARKALEAAVTDFDSSQFRTRFQDYMGTGSLSAVKAGENSLKQSVRAMFGRVATLSFTVVYDPDLGDRTNADMWGYTGAGLSTQDIFSAVDEYRSGPASGYKGLDFTDATGVQRVKGGSLVMRLGPNIWDMPFTSTTEQSQVETFLHELSHHAAGTIDDQEGGECYGLPGVTRLKALGPARAVRNAENVGFFCVSYF